MADDSRNCVLPPAGSVGYSAAGAAGAARLPLPDLPVACFLLAADSAVLQANPRAQRLLAEAGCSLPAEIAAVQGARPGLRFEDMLAAECRVSFRNALQQALAGGPAVSCRLSGPWAGEPCARHWNIEMSAETPGLCCHVVLIDMTACRHDEMETRRKLEMLTNLSNHLPGILFQYRLDPDGTVHFPYISQAINTMYGIDEQRAAQDAQSLQQHVHPEDAAGLRGSMLHSAKTLQPWRYEYRMVLLSGEIIWRALEAWPEKMPDGAILWHGHTIDISRRKQVEERLRQSEERWKRALEGVGDGVWDWDVGQSKIAYSRRWKAMLGYDDDEIGDAPEEWLSRVHPDDVMLTTLNGQRLTACSTEGGMVSTAIEVRLRTRSGAWAWVLSRGSVVSRDAQGQVLRVIGTNTDITDRKQHEDGLRENEERWKLALEGAGHGVWDWNMQNNEALFSRRWKEIIGYAEDELSNHADEWASRIHPQDMPLVVETQRQVMFQPERGSASIEFRMRCKDGQWRWMLGSGLLVNRDAEGRPQRMVGTLSDVHARKQIEETLRLNLQELDERRREAEQLSAAKSHFLNAATHDLRQPLYAAQLFADALLDEVGSLRQGELVGHLQSAIQAMSAQLELLLDVSRLDMGKLQIQSRAVAVRDIFQSLAITYGPQAERVGVQLKFRMSAQTVHTDPVLIGRLLGNLIDNAIKFADRQQGNILVCTRREARGLRIEVRDNGMGIAAEHQQRIFDEYYQIGNPARNAGEGLGLGLNIVRRIARLLDAPLALRTRSGRGSTFVITLPLAGESQQS